ncbi:MAG: MATE family efflux transporter [Candidatus Zixiibacteriota bacterium]|nr:MAG: MATE family efflux transporter [candidate division Zixibacteria bacterium]
MINRNQQPTQSDRITSGPISRTIVSLAMPVVMAMFMEFALASTDYYWVGKLGPTAQDAVTSSMVIMWTVYALINIISVGITALVARYVGARDLGKVTFYIKQGMVLAGMVGIIFAASGFLLAPALLGFMDAGPKTLALAIPYLRIFFVSSIFFFWMDTLYAVFRASGDTKTPTLVGVTSVVINMALDPLLIFGWGPVPSLGVTGASIATAIAVFISSAIITLFLVRGKLGYPVPGPFPVKPDFGSMFKIARIGLPVSSQQLVFVLVYWFLIKFVHVFGEAAGAAMGIGNRMESFSYLTCFGFSIAASTMVGQNLGAGKPERAARCAWGATGIAIAITLIISVIFIVLPRLIASVFTDDPQVLEIAIDYLIILGLSQTAMAVTIVLEGSFGGAGDTVPPMLVAIPSSVARIPLAYLLAFTLGWGINGVWWTLTITSFISAITLTALFKRGRWKRKQV